MKLFDLSEGIRKCTACPLYKSRMLAVSGEGKGKIMFVGKAPDLEENRQGLPLVGRPGKFFDELLSIAGLSRDKVFITGAVKCYSKNRNPLSLELKTCKKLWLDKQIDILKPELIVVLGNIALKSLLGGGKVSELHSKVVKKNNLRYFVSYHPSGGIRFPDLKEKIVKDFKKLKKVI